jgi:hypothetical protein
VQIGDLVVFRSDTVPGVIVSERPAKQQTKVPRIGVLWVDCNEVCWEPAEYLRVISKKDNENR